MAAAPKDDDALLMLAFALQSNPGAYAVMVGAGVSAAAGVPTAWDVLTDLIVQIAHLDGDNVKPEDAEQWYHDHKGGREPRYEDVLAEVAPTQIERQRVLRKYFELPTDSPAELDADDAGPQPTLAHKSIARLIRRGVVRVVLTMNFDRLLEKAIRAEGVEPTIVASDEEAAGLAPLHTLNCSVIHLHGDYLNPESMLNTTAELEKYRPKMRELLHRVLEDYGLIVAGWSAKYDPALRSAIAERYPSRFTMAWVEPFEQAQVAVELRQLKQAKLVPMGADDAFGRLVDAVESMALRRSRHPLTIAVAAETAKRELSGRWTAISLHDTLAAEFARLHEHPDFHLTVYNAPDEQYLEMLQRAWAATSMPAAMVAVLSYWGNERTDSWWLDEIERFAVQPRSAGGNLREILLRVVAGSVLFFAAGVSAVAGKRYDLLGRLLRLERTNPLNQNREILGRALDPLHVYEITNREHQHYVHVRPILAESLGLGLATIDDAWQRFEILRLATTLMAHEHFTDRLTEFLDKDAVLDAVAQELRPELAAGAGGAGSDKYREAWLDRDKSLGKAASLGSLGRPHLLAVSSYQQGGERWGSPVADGIVRDLTIEGDQHPFVTAGIGKTDSRTLRLAVEAVGVQLTRRAVDLERAPIPPGAAMRMPNELWLD